MVLRAIGQFALPIRQLLGPEVLQVTNALSSAQME